MKITVIGCGRWGSFIAWYLNKIGHELTVYGLADAPSMQQLLATRSNGLLEFPPEIKLSLELESSLESEVVVISVNSQGLRSLMGEIMEYKPKNKIFVLCMKGIEIETGKRLSEICSEFVGNENKVAVWIGPGHPQDFCRGIPNCMVIDSEDEETKKKLVDSFSSPLIRFYYGNDIVGNEIGAALKNVIGIAAGMLDGLGLSALKGALMSRATREVYSLIEKMGGNGRSAYGLCHLGDYEATVFSPHSHNRAYGEMFVRGEQFGALAEGYYTAEAVHNLVLKYGVEMPICETVYGLLYRGLDPKSALDALFARSIKTEY